MTEPPADAHHVRHRYADADGGHWAIETHGPEVIARIRDFLGRRVRVRPTGTAP